MATEKSPRVCLLSGNFFERQETLVKIYKALGEYEKVVIDDQCSYEYMVQQINEQCISGFKKLIVMNDWPEAKETKVTMLKNFLKLLGNIPTNCVVVMNNVDAPDDIKNFVKSHGRTFEFLQYIPVNGASEWISNFLNKRGKNIDGENAMMIAKTIKEKEKSGLDVDQVVLSLMRLEYFVGNRKNITKDDILATCFDNTEFVIWHLFYALDDKNVSKALVQIQKIWMNSNKTLQDVSGMISTMIWRYRLLSFLKEGFAKKWDKDRIYKELQQVHKLEREGNKFKMKMKSELNKKDSQPKMLYTPFLADMMLNSYYGKDPVIKKYLRKEIFVVLRVLEESLKRIRHGCTVEESIILFELIVCTICGTIKEKEWRNFRRV